MTRLVEDKRLREAFRQGKREALEEVYREYAKPLYGLLYRGFGLDSGGRSLRFHGYRDSLALDDTVQEVFTRAFKESARLSYDGLRPYRNYLFTIARNIVTDELRRRTRLFEPIGGQSIEEIQDAAANSGSDVGLADAPPLHQSIEQRQLRELVDKFIGKLTEEDRRVFDLRFREAQSVEACAARLGVSEYRVKRTEKRLRRRFLETMQHHGYLTGYTPDAAVVGAWIFLVASGALQSLIWNEVMSGGRHVP
mgnify:CR=1 FL=1